MNSILIHRCQWKLPREIGYHTEFVWTLDIIHGIYVRVAFVTAIQVTYRFHEVDGR